MFSPFLNGLEVDHRRHAVVVQHVAGPVGDPLADAAAAGVEEALQCRGIGPARSWSAPWPPGTSWLRSASARPPRPPGRDCRRRRRALTRGRDTPASPSGTGGCLARPDRRSACPPSAALPPICPARSAETAGRPWARSAAQPAAAARRPGRETAVHPRPGRGRNRRAGQTRGPPLRPPRRPRAAPHPRPGSRAAPPPARGAAAPPLPAPPPPSAGRPLAAGFACSRPLGPVSVNGASPRGVVMMVSPRSSPCPLHLRGGGRRRRLIADHDIQAAFGVAGAQGPLVVYPATVPCAPCGEDLTRMGMKQREVR